MSADNYIYVRKREDGKYGVSHRFASTYYSDSDDVPREHNNYTGTQEGWYVGREDSGIGPFATIEEATAANPKRLDWITEPPEDRYVLDNVQEALRAAYTLLASYGVVEYGVSLSPEVQEEFTGIPAQPSP